MQYIQLIKSKNHSEVIFGSFLQLLNSFRDFTRYFFFRWKRRTYFMF
jgi:hypothetical protein